MKSALWMKLGRFRINLAQVAFIERDAECLLFFNADGAQIFERRFETQRQADQVLRDVFGYEDIQLVTKQATATLHAYCHLRREERVFRLTRIADLRPVGGWSMHRKTHPTAAKPAAAKPASEKPAPNKSAPKPKTGSDDSDSNPQMSLLDPD